VRRPRRSGIVRPHVRRLISTASPAPIPWGFWATIGFGLIAMSAMVALQTLVLFIFVGLNMAYATGRQAPPELMIERLMHDPLMLCIGVLASVPVILGIVWLAVKRRPGWRLVDYLALRGFALRQFVIWFLVLAGVLWTGDQLLQSFGDDSGDAFIRGLLVGGRSVAPLLFAVTVAAPFIEELLFRGFMFRGLAASRAGTDRCHRAPKHSLGFPSRAVCATDAGDPFCHGAGPRTGATFFPQRDAPTRAPCHRVTQSRRSQRSG
jgi:membrane protease YdiL (CAAX protease family)